jgi:hypothetical protein
MVFGKVTLVALVLAFNAVTALPTANQHLPSGFRILTEGLDEGKAEIERRAEVILAEQANATGVAVTETVEETIARLKEVLTGKQHFLKDFILANGIDNRTYIMGLQEEMQGLEKEYKTLVIANTPPTPAPYEVRSGFATPVSTWI